MIHSINAWHCDDCDDNFYTGTYSDPEFCPFCKSTELDKGKSFEIQNKE